MGVRPASGNPVPDMPDEQGQDRPSFGRPVNTVEDLFGHLLDLGQYDLAYGFLATSIEAKGAEHDNDGPGA